MKNDISTMLDKLIDWQEKVLEMNGKQIIKNGKFTPEVNSKVDIKDILGRKTQLKDSDMEARDWGRKEAIEKGEEFNEEDTPESELDGVKERVMGVFVEDMLDKFWDRS